MDKLTDLWGSLLLQNDFKNTLCEMRLMEATARFGSVTRDAVARFGSVTCDEHLLSWRRIDFWPLAGVWRCQGGAWFEDENAAPSEQRGNNLKHFKDSYLKAKARI